ncbi:MAG: recombinase family protein [Eubacteriales bacterium]|nr:recombinase family protein [Eubacteriales bacterium]MDD4326715.1 recombinase family protein [Eubacteriales bacterium]MDD4716742.1 recombinase family protein [Eubacteriales bacterium]
MARYAYMKIDDKDRDSARQALLLDDIGGFERIYVDDMTSDKLNRALSVLKPGDVLYVASADRICCSIREFLKINSIISKAGADFCCLDISFDTRSVSSEQILRTLEILSDIESDAMSRKKKTGIERARAQGRRVGRPPVSIPAGFRTICRKWEEGSITGTEAIRMSGLKSTSFYKKASELGYDRNKKNQNKTSIL